jgi:hypothetical protein
MEFRPFLAWLSTAGASIVAYIIINKLTEAGKPSTWSAWTVRLVSYAISGGIAILAYVGLVLMQYQAEPVNTRAWIEALFVVATTSFGLSTIIHGKERLSRAERVRRP